VGRAVASRIVVLDDAGRPAPPGTDGAVWFGRPDAADPVPDDDGRLPLDATPGWGTVGDVGHLDADQYLYLTGRAGQLIITGGVNVAPREVEDLLAEHPAVDDAAVVGLPDEEFGQRVTAVVVPRGPLDPDELIAWCRERLAHVKCPRTVHLVDGLPRNDAGKLLHRVLLERLSPVGGR
jgi:fatty-acyl-CoA synthase